MRSFAILALQIILIAVGFPLPAASGPIRPSDRRQQQRLLDPSYPSPPTTNFHDPHTHSPASAFSNSTHLEAQPNTVGILFTTDGDEEIAHVWLPLGKRIYTRKSLATLPRAWRFRPDVETGDFPILPLHPLSARLTSVLADSPGRSSKEILRSVVCSVHPVVDKRNSDAALPYEEDDRIAAFTRGDGSVRFGAAQNPWYLDGREVDAYECS